MRMQGSIHPTQDKNAYPVLVLLINVSIDWSRQSVATEAASNTNH